MSFNLSVWKTVFQIRFISTSRVLTCASVTQTSAEDRRIKINHFKIKPDGLLRFIFLHAEMEAYIIPLKAKRGLYLMQYLAPKGIGIA